MNIIGIILLILLIIVLVRLFLYFMHIKQKNESKIFPKSGAFRQGDDCKRPREYLCIKCGDCGRKFIK